MISTKKLQFSGHPGAGTSGIARAQLSPPLAELSHSTFYILGFKKKKFEFFVNIS